MRGGSALRGRGCEVKDRHLPIVVMDNFLRRVITPPTKRISKFVRAGCVAADVGCGPGYFTIPLAELVGIGGRVYAVDSDPKAIRALKAKLLERGLERVVDVSVGSAADMQSIPTSSIDFLLSNGVLCCMTDHGGAVKEMKRVLKRDGSAYVSVARLFRKRDPRAVRKDEWNRILSEFTVKENHVGLLIRWAIVSP